MRAIFLRDEDKPEVGEVVTISDDRATHLIKSTRVRVGENVLILDGHGTSFLSEALAITRREIDLKIIEINQKEQGPKIDLCLGLPKKDAFELALKNAVELGIQEVIPFEAEYSQWTIKNSDRAQTIIESALIQSNNYFATKLHSVASDIRGLENIFASYDHIILTTLKEKKDFSTISVNKDEKYLVVIGPEGGLSDSEEDFILSLKNSSCLKLNTPILRTPNAVSTVTGYIHGKFAAL